jgi:hypothetical protein
VGRLVAERRGDLVGAEELEEACRDDDDRAEEADREAAGLLGP